MNNPRDKLPFRKNCEGYLLLGNDEVIAQDTGKGYIEFPGGGVDDLEDPGTALQREAREEAGVVSSNLKKVKVIQFIWGSEWAKSEKQKQRYLKYKGEEMHLFIGKVEKLVLPSGDASESGWKGKVSMKIDEAIKAIEKTKPYPEEMKEYREAQVQFLKKLKNII